MFWRRKDKTKDSGSPASAKQGDTPQPRFIMRRPAPTNPAPPPPVVYVPPPPPAEPVEEVSAAPTANTEPVQVEPPLPPSADEIAAMRERGVALVTSGQVDAGISLLLDVWELVPDDLEASVWIGLVRSGGGEARLSPAIRQRIEKLKPHQEVKPLIIDRR